MKSDFVDNVVGKSQQKFTDNNCSSFHIYSRSIDQSTVSSWEHSTFSFHCSALRSFIKWELRFVLPKRMRSTERANIHQSPYTKVSPSSHQSSLMRCIKRIRRRIFSSRHSASIRRYFWHILEAKNKRKMD